MMRVRDFLLGIFVLLLPTTVSATNCPDAGVVVVASVFTTLAVVLIVLGILGFLLWKRRKDIARPEKQKLKNGDHVSGSPGDTFAYSNSAFEKDIEAGEGCFDANRDSIPNNQRLNEPDRDLAKKTWSSLPGSNINYVRQRKSSLGSLDRNSYGNGFMLDSSVEVHLTSQDFIGLGFNIAGSMRDGIFVSQVHNRGPAKESGKFKVGDRIMSMTVSFENMVYEDALTILSYASPYPVKVTLQKEPQLPKNRKLSDVRTNLNHPLYRSHSIENLKTTSSQDQLFHPRRAASEMRYYKKNSPSTKRISREGLESNIIEEVNGGNQLLNDDVFDETPSKVNVVVHKESPKANEDDVDSPNPNVNINVYNKNNNYKFENELPEEVMVKATTNEQFSDPFENLTEQDKLDVLRLTYADPNAVPFEAQSPNFGQSPANGDQRSAPVKPERKKKGSSSTSTPSNSGDFSSLVATATVVTETEQQQVLQPPLEAPPPVPEDFADTEEEIITPEVRSRNVTVNSDTIVLETVNLDNSSISVDQTITSEDLFGDLSMTSTDNDRTLVFSSPQTFRPESPDAESVQEEIFTATQVKKEANIPTNSSVFDETKPVVRDVVNNDKQLSDNIESDNSNQTNTDTSNSAPEIDDEFDKDLPSLDMNLNFDTDSVLFKESFPSRNEKENMNGMSYDISVTELDAMGKKAFDEELQKRENLSNKSGIAFEIRDDFTTGETRMVNTNRVHRTASYDVRLSDTVDKIKNTEISSQRPTSYKGNIITRDDSEEGGSGLGWSGKRLVRSGSFSEIPQDDSVNDWIEDQCLQDDSLIEEHIKEDSKSPVMKQLTRATLVTSNSLSYTEKDFSDDSDTQCASLSSNDASDDSPVESGGFDRTNGDDELGSSPDDTPKKIMNYTSDIITTVEDNSNTNDQTKTITLDVGGDDEDC